MDKASDYESGDCRFESCQGQLFFAQKFHLAGNKNAPPGGLEPPTFRLTAERASRLRHGGGLSCQAKICVVTMLPGDFSRERRQKNFDEDGIRTHAGRAHWISSPTP